MPLAEVFVCAYATQGEGFEEHCDRTDDGGLYLIPDLAPGKYKIEFWSESTEPSYAGEYYDDKTFWEEADEVDVGEGVATTDIDAELAEGSTIEGEVDVLSSDEPVEHALVCAQRPLGEFVGCVETRLSGSYTLSGLPPGDYKIQFIPASNLYNLLNQFYDHKMTFAEADVLTLSPGDVKTEIDADLEEGAEIHGTVYSATTGLPVPGVEVCALAMENGEGAWVPARCGPSSSAGSYALFGLLTDSYKVAFSPEFTEFFGEEIFEDEDDGYFTQYFNNKATLADADLLPVLAPEVRIGIDGHIQLEHATGAIPVSVPPPSIAMVTPKPHHKRARHCRAGFRKKKVNGKRRCVKRHRRRHNHTRSHR